MPSRSCCGTKPFGQSGLAGVGLVKDWAPVVRDVAWDAGLGPAGIANHNGAEAVPDGPGGAAEVKAAVPRGTVLGAALLDGEGAVLVAAEGCPSADAPVSGARLRGTGPPWQIDTPLLPQ